MTAPHAKKGPALDKAIAVAERATSAAVSATRQSTGSTAAALLRDEVVTKALSLARTLISDARCINNGAMMNRRGIVQAAGSHLDTLCAELAVYDEWEKGGAS
jgi:hypothetical protein